MYDANATDDAETGIHPKDLEIADLRKMVDKMNVKEMKVKKVQVAERVSKWRESE